MIDFSQLITDRNARILLGKRFQSEQQGKKEEDSGSDKEQSLERALQAQQKRRKIQELEAKKKMLQSLKGKN